MALGPRTSETGWRDVNELPESFGDFRLNSEVQGESFEAFKARQRKIR